LFRIGGISIRNFLTIDETARFVVRSFSTIGKRPLFVKSLAVSSRVAIDGPTMGGGSLVLEMTAHDLPWVMTRETNAPLTRIEARINNE
jgi:hypothetical protein